MVATVTTPVAATTLNFAASVPTRANVLIADVAAVTIVVVYVAPSVFSGIVPTSGHAAPFVAGVVKTGVAVSVV